MFPLEETGIRVHRISTIFGNFVLLISLEDIFSIGFQREWSGEREKYRCETDRQKSLVYLSPLFSSPGHLHDFLIQLTAFPRADKNMLKSAFHPSFQAFTRKHTPSTVLHLAFFIYSSQRCFLGSSHRVLFVWPPTPLGGYASLFGILLMDTEAVSLGASCKFKEPTHARRQQVPTGDRR